MRRVSRAGYSRGRVLRQRGRDARAVAAGLGLSILSEIAIQADHRVLTAKDGFSPIDKKNGLLRRACNFFVGRAGEWRIASVIVLGCWCGMRCRADQAAFSARRLKAHMRLWVTA